MKKILVTTDLSTNSKSAINFAVQLAKQTDSQLMFFYVVDNSKSDSGTAAYKNEEERHEEYLYQMKKFIQKTIGSEIKNAGYEVGFGHKVSDTIIDAARKYKANFICMSTRGAGAIKKLFGTNSSSVITKSNIPVIVIPQRYKPEKIIKIFFACDFAALSKEMKVVQSLSEELKADLNVYHYDYMIELPENLKKLERKAEKFINKRTKFFFRKQKIENSLSEHIRKEIRKEKPSLVVVFTKQDRNWFDRLIMPSESAEMSFHSNIPMVTFKKGPAK